MRAVPHSYSSLRVARCFRALIFSFGSAVCKRFFPRLIRHANLDSVSSSSPCVEVGHPATNLLRRTSFSLPSVALREGRATPSVALREGRAHKRAPALNHASASLRLRSHLNARFCPRNEASRPPFQLFAIPFFFEGSR